MNKEDIKQECEYCQGVGYILEHSSDPNHHDEYGVCTGYCPVQVQCDKCEGTGIKVELKNN